MLRAVKNYGVLTAARIKALGLTQTELAEEIKKRGKMPLTVQGLNDCIHGRLKGAKQERVLDILEGILKELEE